MRKFIYGTFLVLMSMFVMAQTEKIEFTSTDSGNVFVGLNTSGIGFTNVDDVTNVNVGLTTGVFAVKNLALVGSVGYKTTFVEDQNTTNDWYYGAGLRQYIDGRFPLQVDWRGSIGNNSNPSKSFMGFQGGYAWFVLPNLSIEPTVRYDLSLKDEYSNVFSGGVGVNLFFN